MVRCRGTAMNILHVSLFVRVVKCNGKKERTLNFLNVLKYYFIVRIVF